MRLEASEVLKVLLMTKNQAKVPETCQEQLEQLFKNFNTCFLGMYIFRL